MSNEEEIVKILKEKRLYLLSTETAYYPFNNEKEYRESDCYREYLRSFLYYGSVQNVEILKGKTNVSEYITRICDRMLNVIGKDKINSYLKKLEIDDIRVDQTKDQTEDKLTLYLYGYCRKKQKQDWNKTSKSKLLFLFKGVLLKAIYGQKIPEEETIKKHSANFKYYNSLGHQVRALAHIFVAAKLSLSQHLLEERLKKEILSELIEGICHIQEEFVLRTDQDVIYDISVNSNKKILVSSGAVYNFKIFHLDTRKQKIEQSVNQSSKVWSVQISNDGTKLAVSTRDGKVTIYDITDELQLKELTEVSGQNQEKATKSISFNKGKDDDKYLVTVGNDQSIKVWNVNQIINSDNNSVATRKKAHDDYIQVVCFYNVSGNYLIITGSFDNKVKLWSFNEEDNNPHDKIQLLDEKSHNDRVLSVTFDRYSRLVASAGKDKKIKIYQLDLNNNQLNEIKEIECPDVVRTIKFYDKNLIAGLDDQTIKVYDPKVDSSDENDHEIIDEFQGHGDRIWCLETDPETDLETKPPFYRIFCGDDNSEIRAWLENKNLDFQDEYPTAKTFWGHKNTVNTVDINSGGNRIVSGGDDCLVKLWDFMQKKALYTHNGHEDIINEVKFVPQSDSQIVSASSDGTIRFWENGKQQDCLQNAECSRVNSIDLSNDHNILVAVTADSSIIFWPYHEDNKKDMEKLFKIKKKISEYNNEQNQQFPDNLLFPYKVIFIKETSLLACTINKYIILFEYKIGQKNKNIEDIKINNIVGCDRTVYNIASSPNGSKIAFADFDGNIFIYDVNRQQKTLLTKLPENTEKNRVYGLDISKDNNYIISSHFDSSIKVWDLSSGNLMRTYQGHKSRVLSISVNSNQLVSASADKSVKLWVFDQKIFTLPINDQLEKLLNHIKKEYGNAFAVLEGTEKDFNPEEREFLKNNNN